jgi:hypothetical protein
MGPNHSFLGFIKHTPRDSSEGWAYINKHMLSSSILHKNKEVLARNGGGKFGKGMCFRIHIIGSKCCSWTWHPLFIIGSRFGKSICLSFDWLQGHILSRLWVSAAKSLVVSFICSREVHLKPLFELAIYSCPFLPSRPSLCPFSSIFMICFTFKICYLFRVIDGGYIKALLWWVLSRRLQLIIWKQDLEIIWYLGTCMPQWQVLSLSTVGFHHWPLIGRFRWMFDLSSFSHIHWIVLVYLGNHWH